MVSLALGIGANTAIFQLIDAIRLKLLPVKSPEQLVFIDFTPSSLRAGSWSARTATMTYPIFEEIQKRQQAFTGVMAWSPARFNLAQGGEPRFAEGLYVNGDLFRQLGVGAVLGRTLTAADDTAACNAGAVLSYEFWQREFGGERAVLNETVSLAGHVFPVIGVTPASFFGLEVGRQYDVAIPLCADRLIADDHVGRIPVRQAWWISAMGRLKPGWTVQRADANLRALSPEIMRATLPAGYRPDLAAKFLVNTLISTESSTGFSPLRKQYEAPLWILMATAALVLLIACANLANLLLARASAREQEMAVRLAIGASRKRLIQQLLTESLVLAFLGAALGIGLAEVLSRALVTFISSSRDPLFVDVGMDWRMLGFTAGLAVCTCLIFGLMPAWRATFLAPAAVMRGGGRSTTPGRERFTMRRALVTAQVALSLVLLFGALLFVRSLHNLLSVDPGFRAEQILSVSVDFSRSPLTQQKRLAVYGELGERLRSVPGVISVAQVDITPLSGGTWDNLVAPDDQSAAASGRTSFFNLAGPGYFKTMRTAVLAGREFDDHDTASTPKLAVVNQMFAQQFFGGANPVGHTFHLAPEAGQPEQVFQIVGLVANTKYAELREDFKPIAFFAIAQDEHPNAAATFVLRSAAPISIVSNEVRAAIGAMSSQVGVETRPLTRQMEESVLRERLMATLSGGFGALAALLAMFGLYGVIAYMVARRQKEIGVRMALGADRSSVVRLVLREAVVLLGFGLVVGIALALWLGKAAAALLFGLQARDAVSLVAAGSLLAVIALLASYWPARRAAALDPISTLRNE